MTDAGKVVALALGFISAASQDVPLHRRYAEFDALNRQEKLEVAGILAKVCGAVIKDLAGADNRAVDDIVNEMALDVRMQLFDAVYGV